MLFDKRQTVIRRKVFYRRCRRVLQIWAEHEDGIAEMVFERCTIDGRVFSPCPRGRPAILQVFPSGLRYDRNRGRHWDRKRK